MAAKKVKVLGFDEVIDTARFLGWHTHDAEGALTGETKEVARALAGKVTESVVLPTLIAAEYDRYRAERNHVEKNAGAFI